MRVHVRMCVRDVYFVKQSLNSDKWFSVGEQIQVKQIRTTAARAWCVCVCVRACLSSLALSGFQIPCAFTDGPPRYGMVHHVRESQTI